MKTRKIIAPIGAQYLGDIPEYANELPDNCLFHKGKTGCGGTTIALKNNLNTIICVPFRSLIFNKLQNPSDFPYRILGVCQQIDGSIISDEKITRFVNEQSVIKIMTTYDSLPRVIKAIQDSELSPFTDFRLIIDEYQVLFNSYGYRYKAVREVLKYIPKFEYVTCMTATPIQREYLFHELKRFRIEEVIWPEEPKTKVNLLAVNSIIQGVKLAIQEDSANKNFHLFVNSVKLIAGIIKFAELTPMQTRIICADNNPTNGKTNAEKLPEGFKVGKITDPICKFNFYTCCAFEGCDIFDENGKTIIVSDAYNPYTLLDIETSVPQIIGRIRNSQYKYDILHIFSTISSDETDKMLIRDESWSSMLERTESFVCDVNRMVEKRNRFTTSELYNASRYHLNRSSEYEYIYWNEERKILQCDRFMFLLEIYKIKVIRRLYTNPLFLIGRYTNNGFEYSYNEIYFEPLMNDKNYTKSSFRESFKRYVLLKEDNSIYYSFRENEKETIARWYPFIPKAYSTLGNERVEALNYRRADIKKEIIIKESQSNNEAVRRLFLERHNYNQRIPSSEIKDALQGIYSQLGLTLIATAKQIKNYFNVREVQPKINGHTTRCYILSEEILPD